MSALNYYNPFVAVWLWAPQGEAAAAPQRRSRRVQCWPGGVYAAHRVPVGDVARAFRRAISG